MVSSARRESPESALVLTSYAVGASLVVVFQRYLTFHFDQFTQNFFRFLTGAGCLLLLCVLLWPGELRRLLLSRRGMMGVGVIAVVGLVGQALAVEGLARTSAVLGGLIPILGVPLSVALGALIFPDERAAVRGRGFLLGAPLALFGAAGLALSGGTGEDVAYSQGAFLLLGATLLSSGLILVSKRMVLSFHPVCVTTLNTSVMCPLFLIGAWLWGDPGQVGRVSSVTLSILLLSGAYGLLVGGALFYFCLQRYGMILTTFTNLAAPVFTGLFGYLLFREALTPPEIASGVVLLAGCYLVVAGPGRRANNTGSPPTSSPKA